MKSVPAVIDNHSTILIIVAVLTYKRVDLLGNLLSKISRIKLPSNSQMTLLVIDNDPAGSARSLVENGQYNLVNLRYVIEQERGIPFARNRAIDEAINFQADALCFIDDDEYPDEYWLLHLVEAWRNTRGNIIGGPVAVAPADKLEIMQRIIHKSLCSRAERKNNATMNASKSKKRFTVVTNNWFCDVSWLKLTGIRFDESYRFTGGSDTAFFRAASKIGCTAVWEPNALVHEIIPAERLTLTYQFNRGRFQSMNHFYMKYPTLNTKIIIFSLLVACLKFFFGIVLLLVPVRSWSSLVVGLRSIAWSVGRVQAILGKRSTLYK